MMSMTQKIAPKHTTSFRAIQSSKPYSQLQKMKSLKGIKKNLY